MNELNNKWIDEIYVVPFQDGCHSWLFNFWFSSIIV